MEENVDGCCDHLLNLEEEYLQDVADVAPMAPQKTYTEIFEQTFSKTNQNSKEGFVVANAPWEKKKKGGVPAPNTASHEDFPGFGPEPIVNDAPSGASAWNQYR